MNIKEIEEFLSIAKKKTYASQSAPRVNNSRAGSIDYEYTTMMNDKKMTYHDTFFGGTKFMGEEVVYINEDKPCWGMNYYGVTLDESLSEEVMDNAIRPALMQVGIDKKVLPVRGPSKFEQKEYTYTFESTGTIENFIGTERIYKNNTLIYELHCHGGVIR